jgi:hypothetical protein
MPSRNIAPPQGSGGTGCGGFLLLGFIVLVIYVASTRPLNFIVIGAVGLLAAVLHEVYLPVRFGIVAASSVLVLTLALLMLYFDGLQDSAVVLLCVGGVLLIGTHTFHRINRSKRRKTNLRQASEWS